MTPTINKHLNLVVPIIRADETKLYVHSTPIRPEMFEKFHLVLAKTFSAFAHNGLDPMSGPSVAALILKDVAQSTFRMPGVNWWDGSDGVGGEGGLMAEIRRLSNCILPDENKGWTTIPLQNALDRKMITEEERSELVNILTFFTVVSLVAPRVDRPRLVNGMATVYELQTTYFNSTEFANSLKMLTQGENTGDAVPA